MEVKKYVRPIVTGSLALVAGAAMTTAGEQQHNLIDDKIGYVHQDHGRFGNALDTLAHAGVLNGQAGWNLITDIVTTAKSNGVAPDVNRPLALQEVILMDAEGAAGVIAISAGTIALLPVVTLAAAGALTGETRRRH